MIPKLIVGTRRGSGLLAPQTTCQERPRPRSEANHISRKWATKRTNWHKISRTVRIGEPAFGRVHAALNKEAVIVAAAGGHFCADWPIRRHEGQNRVLRNLGFSLEDNARTPDFH